MGGLRLSVSRLGLSAIMSGGGASGPETDPNVNSVDADGWQINYTSPPAEFDPVSDPKYVVVSRPGFNASGGSTTVTDNLEIMKRVRQPYPNENTLTTNNAAIADFVFSGDTISGVTNNSTVAFHKPICMWLDHDLQRVYNQQYTAKLAVAHWAARNGRPVAAVKFSATDGANTVESTVSTMGKTDYSTSGLSVPHFEATLDLSSLDEDTLITIDAEIFPWVGDSSFIASIDFATYPSINFCEMKVFNAVTSAEDAIYAYVDGVGAGTPQASTTEVTAQANPFATVAAAAAAIEALDGADVSRGEVVIEASTTLVHASFSSVTVGDTPLIIRGVNRSTSIYQQPVSALSNGVCDTSVFKNLTLQRTTSTNVISLSNGAFGTTYGNMMSFVDVDFDLNGNGNDDGRWLYQIGRCWAINCDTSMNNIFNRFSSVQMMVNAIGCNGDLTGATGIYNMAGCKSLEITYNNVGLPSANRETPSGQFFLFNFLSTASAGGEIVESDLEITSTGLAIVGCIFEKQVSGSVPALKINADGNTDDSQNVVIQLCSVVGQRTNFLYNDASPYANKYGQVRFCAHRDMNTKSDVFETDGTAVNNWSNIYKVGWRANAYFQGDSQGNSGAGVGYWLGEVLALGDSSGSDATPLDADWVDDQSSDGGGAGDGDYRPGGSTALPQIPSGLAPYPYDQNGAAISNDGTAYVGALQ